MVYRGVDKGRNFIVVKREYEDEYDLYQENTKTRKTHIIEINRSNVYATLIKQDVNIRENNIRMNLTFGTNSPRRGQTMTVLVKDAIGDDIENKTVNIEGLGLFKISDVVFDLSPIAEDILSTLDGSVIYTGTFDDDDEL
jgi:hypothetical protein